MTAQPHGLEGLLPPCLRIAVFEGWRALQHDRSCGADLGHDKRYVTSCGVITLWAENPYHPGLEIPHVNVKEWHAYTDDPTEAESIWLEACERLRELL